MVIADTPVDIPKPEPLCYQSKGTIRTFGSGKKERGTDAYVVRTTDTQILRVDTLRGDRVHSWTHVINGCLEG